MSAWYHRIATIAVTVGAWAASALIPAALAIPLGPVAIPVAALVQGAIALAAAQGILPHPVLAKVLEVVKKPVA